MDNTLEFRARLYKSIAQGCLTNSKHPNCFVNGVYPTGIIRGKGPFVEADNHVQYFDTICGLGSVSIGIRNTTIDNAIINHIQNVGSSFSLASPLEIEAAEFLLENYLHPYDAVKFTKTGAEATSAAVRIARVATKKKWIIQIGYHGWHDQWISTKANPEGIPDHLMVKEYASVKEFIEQINSFEHLKETAAVIIEPIMLEHSEDNSQELMFFQDLCKKHDLLVIFDEIVCGMRIKEGFISKLLKPDLVCFGKGVGNGWPISGIVGKKHLMHDQPYFVSSTFAGETVSLCAMKNVLKYWKGNNFQYVYEQANLTMSWINQKLASTIPEVTLEGYGTRGYWKGPIDKIALLFQEACKAQVLLGRSFFYNFASAEFDSTLRSRLEDAFYKLSMPTVRLMGQAPQEPFKRV